MERDNLITEKIDALKIKKEALTECLNNMPKYRTNLMVNGKSLRTVSAVKDLYEYFNVIYKEFMTYKAFAEFCSDNKFDVEHSANHKIFGYTWTEWKLDFYQLMQEIETKNRLNDVNTAITKLDRFYSQDKRETEMFNALLDDVNNII